MRRPPKKATPSTSAPRLPRAHYRDKPVEYFREVLGVELWSRQADVARAVAAHPRTATRSGQKVGKSKLVGLALWWVDTREEGRAILTSSGKRQVKSVLWRELRKMHREARVPIGGVCHLDPGTGLQFADGREVIGFTTDDAVKMGGYSGGEIFFFVDEGSGFPTEIFEAVEGNVAGGGKIFAPGNPTKVDGWFFDAFHADAHLWHTEHISAAENPNVVQRRIVIPGLATYEHVQMMRKKYGPVPEKHPVYRVRVDGNFPGQQADGVIALDDVELAQRRYEKTKGLGPLELGVDVARFGDDESVIQPRRGYRAGECTVVNSMDGWEVGGKVLDVVRQLRRSPGERAIVKVDGIGVGASVVDFLRHDEDAQRMCIVVDVNVGASATEPEDYVNLRSQVWFGIASWLKEGGALPPGDRDRNAELLAATYRTDARNRIQVASKDDLKKKLKRSPDRADALALAVFHVNAEPGAETIGDPVARGLERY